MIKNHKIGILKYGRGLIFLNKTHSLGKKFMLLHNLETSVLIDCFYGRNYEKATFIA